MMMRDVEFRYLDVKWINKNTLKSIEASQGSIPVETESEGYSIETFTYHKYYPRIGLTIHSDVLSHPPYFKNSMGKKIELLPIKDSKTNITWWIHSDGWDSKKNYYHTELYRTVGKVDLVVQNQPVTINNNAISLTVDDLEQYLQDFKQDLWQIILKQDSIIKGTVSKNSSMLSEESLQFFKDFSDSLEAITKNIGVELKETQEQKPIKSVRPVNRTFREIATKGFRKQLTSRSYIESYDTPDNRYLHYCASRVLYISKQLSSILDKQNGYLTRLIDSNRDAIAKNESRKSKRIEKDVFDDETTHIVKRLNGFDIQLEEAINKQWPLTDENRGLPYGSYDLEIGVIHKRLSNYYFANKINGEPVQSNPKYKDSYIVIGMPESVFKLIELEKGVLSYFNLTIKGWVEEGSDNTTLHKPFFYLYFYSVDNLLLPEYQKIQRELSDRAIRRQEYERVDWELPLNNDEKREIIRETEFLVEKNKLFDQGLYSQEEILRTIEPISLRLKKINRFFKNKNIKKSAIFPSTMSFVQNHIYSRAKSSFSKINNLDGMDGDLFTSLFAFDQIGIIEIPMIYERWCLLQIIKLLTEVYGFSLDKDWRTLLVKSVINNQQNIEFEFYNSINNKRIILGYQKTILNKNENNKPYYPDFILDIEYQAYVFKEIKEGNNKTISYEDYGKESMDAMPNTFEQWSVNGMRRKRFIIDPKFKDNLRQRGFEKILDELMDKKNYDEDGNNPVFILHPQSNAIQKKTSPLDWGGHSDYGQSCEHNRGFVFLLPSSKHGNTLDNLQRLLGMFLQSTSHFIDYGEKAYWVDTVCVSCGASSCEDFDIVKGETKGGKNKWNIKCKHCSHTTDKTICFKCKRDLYKNQSTWTYHRTKAEQISNVVCPSCQEFL
jgi:uncharacterized protein YktA (UPF0223 family)